MLSRHWLLLSACRVRYPFIKVTLAFRYVISALAADKHITGLLIVRVDWDYHGSELTDTCFHIRTSAFPCPHDPLVHSDRNLPAMTFITTSTSFNNLGALHLHYLRHGISFLKDCNQGAR